MGRNILYFSAPEDVILQKLKVGRPRDYDDMVSVLVRSERLINLPYLKRWAKRLRLKNELVYLMKS